MWDDKSRYAEREKMIIQDFEPRHTEEASEIALDIYKIGRAHV